MASTFSGLKVELMETGSNAGDWGRITNVNMGTTLEEAIAGTVDVAFSNANVTLTLVDSNSSQPARNMRLRLTGTATTGYNLVLPNTVKPYIVSNGTDGTITVKNSTGTGIAVPADKTMWVFNNGTNVVDVVNYLTAVTTPDLLVSGGTSGNVFDGAFVSNALGTNTVNSAARLYLSGGNSITRGVYVQGINTGGSDNAHDMVFGTSAASSTPAERMRITNGGTVVVGSNATWDVTGTAELVQVLGSVGVASFAASATGRDVVFAKSRSTNVATHTSVVSGDVLGSLRFYGDNNPSAAFLEAAKIEAAVDGAVTTNGDMPGRLVFYTRADGTSGALTEVMRATNAGDIGIGTNAPAYRLDVQKAGDVAGQIKASTTGNASFYISANGASTSTLYFENSSGTTAYIQVGTGGQALNIRTAAGTVGDLTLGTNNTTRVTVNGTTGDVTFANAVTFSGGVNLSGELTGPVSVNAGTSIVTGFSVIGTNTGAAAGPVIDFYRNSSSPANADQIAILRFRGNKTGTNNVTYAAVTTEITDSSASHDGALLLQASRNSTLTDFLRLDGSTNIVSVEGINGFSIARTSVTSAAAGDGNVFSGTYTPSLVSSSNTNCTVTFAPVWYTRVGNVVQMGGTFTVDTVSSGAVGFEMTLPVASNFADDTQAAGVATTSNDDVGGVIRSNSTSDRLAFSGTSTNLSARSVTFTATYLVI